MNRNLVCLAALCLVLSACSLNEEHESPVGAPSGATTPGENDAGKREVRVAAEAAPADEASQVPLSVATIQDQSRMALSAPCCFPAPFPQDRENYQHFDENPVKLVSEHPVSTFSIDVDTGSYANVRRFLNAGTLPPEDAVRVEEIINYFGYEYPVPASRDRPFSVTTSVAPAPWNADRLLLQVGLKGYEVPAERRAAAFGQKLRGGEHLDGFGYREIAALAAGARGEAFSGDRGEFLSLVKLADSLAMIAGDPGSEPGSPDIVTREPQVRR